MSRSREAEVLVVDTNPSIGTELAAAKDALVLHVQQKLIQMPTKSEIGLVVMGTSQTSNAMDADGNYQNISEVKAIEQTDVKLLKTILGLKHGVDAGDWLSAVVVAMDMLKRHCGDKKYEKGIIVITNEARPVADVEQLEVIAQALADFKIQFQLYRIGSRSQVKKESVIQKFVDHVGGQVHSVGNAKRLRGAMSGRSVTSQSLFRGNLYFSAKVPMDGGSEGTLLCMKVWAYAKTKVATLPSLKKRSRDDEEEVAIERKYVLEDDNTQDVDFANLIKAHSYGREDVPISKDDASSIKKKSEKEVHVLGYLKRSEVSWDELMSNVDCFLPDKDSPEAMLHAFSAFVEALRSSDQVALIRWVRRANDPARLYTVWPGTESGAACLYACRRPFCEDLRPCPFPSLNSKNAPKLSLADQSTKEQLAQAADKLILSLDLDQAMDYRSEFNPVVQGFYSLVNSIVTEGAWKPPDSVGQCLKRDAVVWGQPQVRDSLNALAGISAVQWQPPAVPVKDEVDDGVQVSKHKVDAEDVQSSSIKILGTVVHSAHIDTNDPLPQFVRIWEAQDLEAHDRALQGMMEVVDELVRTSPGERFYARAIECIATLRDYCDKARGDEPDVYNQCFLKLKERYEERTDVTFSAWLGKHKELGPITTEALSRATTVHEAPKQEAPEVEDDDDEAIMDAD